MLLSFTAFIFQTVLAVWLLASASKLLPTTNISWGWLDAVLADVGLLDPNTTWTELGDTFFQGVVILSEPSVLQSVGLVTVLTTNSPPNEPEDMDVPVDDTPPQGIIRQLLELEVAVVEVTLAATTPVDDAITLVSVHPQPTQFPASVTRVGSRLWSSSFAGSTVIAVLVAFSMGFFARSVSLSAGWDNLPTLFVEVCGPSETVTSSAIDSVVSSTVEAHSGGQIRQGEVVLDDIPVSEQAEHGENLVATDDTASFPSGNVARIDVVEPLRTSVGIQFTSEVREVKDASVSCEPVSRASVGIQCSMAIDEQTDKFVPGESRGSLCATAAEGSSPSQMMDDPDVFSVPTVSSEFNIYTMAETMSFPSVDDLRKPTEFERLRQDIRGFGYESEADRRMAPSLPATELGVSPSTSTSTSASPRPVRAKPLEYFRERWGADTKVTSMGTRVLASGSKERRTHPTVYHAMFPLDEAATDEDKYAYLHGVCRSTRRIPSCGFRTTLPRRMLIAIFVVRVGGGQPDGSVFGSLNRHLLPFSIRAPFEPPVTVLGIVIGGIGGRAYYPFAIEDPGRLQEKASIGSDHQCAPRCQSDAIPDPDEGWPGSRS
ncbi:uncharacterized protein ARMOST_06632 [Armillaria ostoyae]|uniref:Transmembrane protein n=1 Tax=Armillaria ostoyae TaxID=47428 RepID=A0A284R3H8_ARMOS|nr:uncharacterized protein ARMOST_06632 [Armillaria ostoyae]